MAQLETLGKSTRKPLRDDVASGHTYKYDVGGRNLYVTINRNAEAEIVEVFINVGRPSHQEISAAGIIGRLISLGLKYGVPPQDIFNQIGGHLDDNGAVKPGLRAFSSIWDAVARALQEEANLKADSRHYLDICPECGGDLVHEANCSKCISCGYTEQR